MFGMFSGTEKSSIVRHVKFQHFLLTECNNTKHVSCTFNYYGMGYGITTAHNFDVRETLKSKGLASISIKKCAKFDAIMLSIINKIRVLNIMLKLNHCKSINCFGIHDTVSSIIQYLK